LSGWEKVIEAVRDNPFGLAALAVLALLMLALKFFRPDSTKVRLTVFLVLVVSFISLAVLALSRIENSSLSTIETDTGSECRAIRLEATSFDTALSSSHIGARLEHGLDGLIGNLRADGAGPDRVVFSFPGSESRTCTYSMTVGYATEVRRPMRVTLNEGPSVEQALAEATGGYGSVKAASVGGKWKLNTTENHLTFATYGQGAMPHLRYVSLSPVE
jgi:hypothetical protein